MLLGAKWDKKGSAGVGEMRCNIQLREGYIHIYVQTFHVSTVSQKTLGCGISHKRSKYTKYTELFQCKHFIHIIMHHLCTEKKFIYGAKGLCSQV